MSDERSRSSRWVPPLLLAGLALVRFIPYRFFEPDDLYIYLQFVRNLLGRGELSFNAGEPTYGFTSPLWLFLLSAAAAIFKDPFFAAKICSLVAAVLSPPLLYALALRLTGERPLAFLAGLAWAWNAWLIRWSLSGLEGALSTAIPLAAVIVYGRERAGGRIPWGAAVLSGMAPLVRPEMIGWWILFVLHAALTFDGKAARRLERAAAAAGPGLILAGGFVAFTLFRFGRAVPNTAEAKGSLLPMFSTLIPSTARILEVIASTSAVELSVFVVAAAIFVAGGGLGRLVAWRDPQAIGLMAAWSMGLVALYAARGVTVYTRYLLMILPFVVLGGFCALAPLWRRDRNGRAAVVALTAVILAQNLVLDRRIILPATRNYQQSEREVNVFIGDWLRAHSDPSAVVAALDIGAIGYVSGRRILDMNGLVTPDLIPFKREGRVNDYLALKRPDYI
ncbi:MAG TPA: hypothetical protein VJ144_03620, partial [Candidatus Polarisedimenticolia bacterium]|nr:hypothetical protein [Candidatus Polarisedimenticolia bacterium]